MNYETMNPTSEFDNKYENGCLKKEVNGESASYCLPQIRVLGFQTEVEQSSNRLEFKQESDKNQTNNICQEENETTYHCTAKLSESTCITPTNDEIKFGFRQQTSSNTDAQKPAKLASAKNKHLPGKHADDNSSLRDTNDDSTKSSKCTMCYKNIQCKHTSSVKGKNKKFQCDVCGEWFKHTYTLRKHKCNHEGKHVCSICNKRYGLPSYLKRHMQIHSDNKKCYKCKFCDKSLCSTSSLSAHERLHTLDKPFKCDVCHKTFTQSSNLTTHKLIHSEYKPFVCELCAKPFRHKQSLLVHLRSHTQERPYSCATCGKTFSQNTHMRTHERLHSGIKPYKCNLCDKTFSRKHHLDYHSETHSGKTYKCSICEKSFTAERAVIQHERIHTGETPYKCDVCGKEFKYHGYLSVHRRIHTGDLPFKCKACPKEFIVASSLQQHLKHNHKTGNLRPAEKETNAARDICTKQDKMPKGKSSQIDNGLRRKPSSHKVRKNENSTTRKLRKLK